MDSSIQEEAVISCFLIFRATVPSLMAGSGVSEAYICDSASVYLIAGCESYVEADACVIRRSAQGWCNAGLKLF